MNPTDSIGDECPVCGHLYAAVVTDDPDGLVGDTEHCTHGDTLVTHGPIELPNEQHDLTIEPHPSAGQNAVRRD